jgi:hypothetical protein
MFLLAGLAGCQTTGTTVTTTKAQCGPWRAITYSSKGDTAQTVKQVRVHNRTGQHLKCWR